MVSLYYLVGSEKLKKEKMKKLILLLFIPILIIVLISEYNTNETQKKLDIIEKELDEKIRIAKEKDSLENIKN